MAKKPPSFSETIKQLIDGCGMTRYEISKLSGVEQSALSRFMSGERGLTTESIDKLAEALDWKIVANKRKGK